MRNIFQCGPAPEVNGVEGILDAYRSTFKTGLAMSEPTDISEVVEAAAAKASQAQVRIEGFIFFCVLYTINKTLPINLLLHIRTNQKLCYCGYFFLLLKTMLSLLADSLILSC
mmetsp:Transcript_68021/g.100948  ORF Transcript_68021/g.100948 Transcript_68021/m.100948 type:complete len:113 (+) Transcript_68021:299-637(+)